MRLRILVVFLLFTPLEVSANQLTITNQEIIVELVDREYYTISYIDSLFVDQEKLNELIKKINEKVNKQPINAMLDDESNLIKEVVGTKLDKKKFVELFLDYFYSRKSMIIKIPKTTVYPRVTSELLAQINEKKVGSYVTYYNQNNKERSHNIHLSTIAINNQVIFPGETFSFNQIVGERTVDKGYKKAPVIIKGELSEDIGGGICQVSSTLFNAVNLRGVQMIERYSHSREVPYVPPGKDATVSWWGPDFVFKNNYSHPILIKSMSKEGKVEIAIYSAEDVHIYPLN